MTFMTFCWRDNKAMARKRVTELEDYTPLEIHAMQVNEYYKALRKAGFPVDQALAIVSDRNSFPDWMIPEPSDIPHHYEDDEDED